MKWEVRRLEAAAFDEVAGRVGQAHVFQTAAWARVRERAGWRPHFFGIAGSGWEAAVLCLEKRKYGASVLFVTRGPVLPSGPGRPLALEAALHAVRSLARSRLAAYAKVSLDLARDETWVEPIVRAAGARPSMAVLGHTATFRLNLALEETQLLDQMESRTRYAIRKAQEAKVEVRGGTDGGLIEDFHGLYRRTCERAQIGHMSSLAMTAIIESGIARIYVAYHQGIPASGALMLRHGGSMWYLLGGSRRGIKHTGAELLHWTAMREARAAGVRTYDLQGIPQDPDKTDPLYGVYLFKRGFGGKRVELLGEFDLGSSPFMARLGAHAISVLGGNPNRRRRTPWFRKSASQVST